MTVLVTGSAGFIGYYLCRLLLERGEEVVGVDNFNDYYDVGLKHARHNMLLDYPHFSFVSADVSDRDAMEALFSSHSISRAVHLAAQAGVRYSLTHPYAYLQSNLMGFGTVLEMCRHHQVEHLVFASSSSVYGANQVYPFKEIHSVDHPVSLYAATKKSNELMAHSYASLYGLPCTGMRFFTVYGPWGRPDMAPFIFVDKISKGEAIDVFNQGNMARDFTYIDDIVAGVVLALDSPACPNADWVASDPDLPSSYAPYRIYNIGNGTPVALMDFISAMELALGKKARLNMMPMQAGDVPRTHADVSRLQQEFGYAPSVDIQAGVQLFVDWYQEYYHHVQNAMEG